MNRLIAIYDNTQVPINDISKIIGNKRFGEIVYKRKTLQQRYLELLKGVKEIDAIYNLDSGEDVEELEHLVHEKQGGVFVHLYAEYIVSSEDKFDVILRKAPYCKENICLMTLKGIAGIIFVNAFDYLEYLKSSQLKKSKRDMLECFTCQILNTEAFSFINQLSVFLQYITGGFDARFFNSLAGDSYTVTKTSNNKKKIESEYTYYHLLPDEMKRWFVLPYNYVETENTASYTMERLHMTDCAIQWVHGAFTIEEFEHLLEKIFYFVKTRKKCSLSAEEYYKCAKALYVDKIKERNEELKTHEMYPMIAAYISASTEFANIDAIMNFYETQFATIKSELCYENIAVIGHGDLCFSNMLYDRETDTLKLIDVKGALKDEDLWTNPLYDLAKLSHSICGLYDYFNNDMYELRMNEDLRLELTIDFNNAAYIEIFKKYLSKNGYSYRMIRILEASLFLSMLPLHMDNPRKVFGFLLNAINILRGTEKCVKD